MMFVAQVKYPRGTWVTVATFPTRAEAARIAAEAAGVRDIRGDEPTQVRVVESVVQAS
jgi:hypothetical protein